MFGSAAVSTGLVAGASRELRSSRLPHGSWEAPHNAGHSKARVRGTPGGGDRGTGRRRGGGGPCGPEVRGGARRAWAGACRDWVRRGGGRSRARLAPAPPAGSEQAPWPRPRPLPALRRRRGGRRAPASPPRCPLRARPRASLPPRTGLALALAEVTARGFLRLRPQPRPAPRRGPPPRCGPCGPQTALCLALPRPRGPPRPPRPFLPPGARLPSSWASPWLPPVSTCRRSILRPTEARGSRGPVALRTARDEVRPGGKGLGPGPGGRPTGSLEGDSPFRASTIGSGR